MTKKTKDFVERIGTFVIAGIVLTIIITKLQNKYPNLFGYNGNGLVKK